MLIRITGDHPAFVAGAVFDENDVVRRAAPIVRWAVGLSPDELRAEISRRGLRATYVRTLTRAEIEKDG